MKYAFLAAFVLAAVIHLAASGSGSKTLRNLTKPFILLALTGFYVFSAPSPRPVIIAALLFSWLGDILLIPEGLAWFTLGGTAFGISHLLFIAGYLSDIDFSGIAISFVLLAAAVFVFAAVLVITKLKPHLPDRLFYPMLLYLTVNGAMNCFAVCRLLCLGTAAAAVTVIGAVLFFISDSILFYVCFNHSGRMKTHLAVMLTYALGEFLIVLGLI